MSQLTVEQIMALAQAARAVRDQAYCPYSGYAVGAAVLAADGQIYTACNVENASYGAAICAERAAVCAAVAAGMRPRGLIGIAVVAGSNAAPCGVCLQVLAEFAQPDCIVITGSPDSAAELGLSRLDELLPQPFRLT